MNNTHPQHRIICEGCNATSAVSFIAHRYQLQFIGKSLCELCTEYALQAPTALVAVPYQLSI